MSTRSRPPLTRRPLWFALLVILPWALVAPAAIACVICLPYPKSTLADQLLQAETVILARERPDQPYSFLAVEVLKGAFDGRDVDAFINSTARRMLRHNSDDVVVLRQEHRAQDWLYTSYADTEYREFIGTMLEQSAGWRESDGDRNRLDFFAEHLSHDHRSIREQAYLEVGRAPYASIKRIAGTVPREQIREFLSNWRLVEWHSLYILMLGQSRHPDDVAYVREQLQLAATYGIKPNLSAWVTAFVEANPETGVEEIERLYFDNRSRTTDELEEVCRGLSVLGSEHGSDLGPELMERRHRIVASYRTLLENYPMMAGPVAVDLTTWQIRAMDQRLRQIQESEPLLDPSARMMIAHYLAISKEFPRI